MPQFADIVEVVSAAKQLPGLRISALLPNLRGAARVFADGVDVLQFPLSVSRAHSLANVRKTPDEMVEELGRIPERSTSNTAKPTPLCSYTARARHTAVRPIPRQP